MFDTLIRQIDTRWRKLVKSDLPRNTGTLSSVPPMTLTSCILTSDPFENGDSWLEALPVSGLWSWGNPGISAVSCKPSSSKPQNNIPKSSDNSGNAAGATGKAAGATGKAAGATESGAGRVGPASFPSRSMSVTSISLKGCGERGSGKGS